MNLLLFAAGLFAFGVVGVFAMPTELARQINGVILWTFGILACLVTLAIAGPLVGLLLAIVLLLVKLVCR